MRAITQHTFGGPEALVVTDLDERDPSAGELRLVTRAIGVNPVDAAVRAGLFPLLGEPPFVLGWDVAGTVDAIGDGVAGHRIGDRVFGMSRFPAEGATYAEQVIVSAADVVGVPEALDDVHAAALPLVGLTAWQALVTVGGIGPGTRVLVQAAGGGVGHVAVQIAKAFGAEVVATASPRKLDFVRSLGADHVADYTTTALSTIEPVDLAIDPFGGAATGELLPLVRDGGTIAMLIPEPDEALLEKAASRGVTLAGIMVVVDPEALTRLVELVEAGKLRPHVQAAYSLDDAREAHVALDGGVQGKLVLVPSRETS